MKTYLLKRLLAMIPTFFGITLITFFIIKLAPGNPVLLKMQASEGIREGQLSVEAEEKMLKLYGLKVDLPEWYESFIAKTEQTAVKIENWIRGRDSSFDANVKPQFVRPVMTWIGENWIQYQIWITNLVQLKFGRSFKDHRLVLEKIEEALPITLSLNLIEIIIVYFISIPLGVFSALRRESLWDKGMMVWLFILYSLPSFWVATLLIMYLASGDHLNWFPMVGIMSDGMGNYSFWQKLLDIAWHLVLPVTAMVYGSFAFLTRFSRSTMLEVIQQDYVRTARAKGLPFKTVIWKHAFRNQLIPLITLMGALLPALLGGSVIIEQIFSIPGMGKLAFESVLARDYPTIMAISTITAFLTLVSLLLSDLAYVWADPRITFESRKG